MFPSVCRIHRFPTAFLSSPPTCTTLFVSSLYPLSVSRCLSSRLRQQRKWVICKRLGLYLTRRRISRGRWSVCEDIASDAGFIYGAARPPRGCGRWKRAPWCPLRGCGVPSPLKRPGVHSPADVFLLEQLVISRAAATRTRRYPPRPPRGIAILFHVCFMDVKGLYTSPCWDISETREMIQSAPITDVKILTPFY